MISQNFVAGNSSKKSASIPMPTSHVQRTFSEIQLEQDERMAELREGQMYHRLLTGMLRRCQEVGCHPKTTMSVQSIIQTQAAIVNDSTPSSFVDGDGDWLLYESCNEVSDKNSSRVLLSNGSISNSNDSTRRGSLSTIGSTASASFSFGHDANRVELEDEQLIFDFDL
ncbi:hypothetical protein ACHAXS_001471 [Conticribra weissflogii]